MYDRPINMYAVGDEAPDFTVKSTSGKDFNLYEELKNGPILLNFYVADFGINCTSYLSKFIESYGKFEELGVKLVPINPDSMDSHKIWKDRLNAPFDFLFDENQKVSKDFEAIVGPGFMVTGYTNREFYLIDKNHKIKFVWKSPIPKIIPELNEILDGIKKGLQ